MKQQTIEIAIDLETDRVYEASELLTMSEDEFSSLRRLAMKNRVERKQGQAGARLVCALCQSPVYLSRYRSEDGNRWFVHDGASLQCPWYEGNKLSADIHRALIYRGAQEGKEHRRIKNFLTAWLQKEPNVTDINEEKVTHGQILKGEWKRPDVQCVIGDKHIVFEIQLSYTFLSEVIKRDEFYRQEGIFIIWVFSAINIQRSVVIDELHFNHRNLFSVDASSENETELRNRLVFSAHFKKPTLMSGVPVDEWDKRFITLDDVIFPFSDYRPYFFDYETERQKLIDDHATALKKEKEDRIANEAALIASRHIAALAREKEKERKNQEAFAEFNGLAQDYLRAAMTYCESNYLPANESLLLDAAEKLKQHRLWRADYESVFDSKFYGFHKVLPKLLSIKFDRSIGHDVKTAFQVLEAGIRQTSKGRQRGFSVLYIWAYKAYKPTVNKSQRGFIVTESKKIWESVKSKQDLYIRHTDFDAAISMLFPELKESLLTRFATGHRGSG